MIATLAAVLAVCAASLAIGQAAIALCASARWSWLSPAVGLALLCAICWGTVRLPGNGTASALAVLILALASVLLLRNRLEGLRGALLIGAPVALVVLAAAMLPFLVEGHFGILGTGLNPDMSQHLLATYRLAHGESSQLLRQGYPLGPHAIVVALNQGLGIGYVQGFSGLTVAVVVLASLSVLAAFADLPPLRRTAAAVVVGIPYLAASYFAQGAFKETMQALFVVAFALSLRAAASTWRAEPLRFLPAALLAVGSVYTYSFPGLIWPLCTLAVWVPAELAFARSPWRSARVVEQREAPTDRAAPSSDSPGRGSTPTATPIRPALLALLSFLVLVAPEVGRMIDFRRFETFAPNGPGLGNLFGQISPFEALGIWPSGDFRLAPGNGAVPAAAFYLGAALSAALLIYGVGRCLRRRETAILSGLAAAALTYAGARIAATPYTTAKAIEIAAPLAALTIVLGLLKTPTLERRQPIRVVRLTTLAAPAYLALAGACSLLALANAPAGPTSYSPALSELRPLLGAGSTVVLAPDELLADQHGSSYLAWELRGHRVCIEVDSQTGAAPPAGVRFIIAAGPPSRPPFPRLRVRRVAGPYVLWERSGSLHGRSRCPLITVRQEQQRAAS